MEIKQFGAPRQNFSFRNVYSKPNKSGLAFPDGKFRTKEDLKNQSFLMKNVGFQINQIF